MTTEFDAAFARLRVMLRTLIAENELLKEKTRTLHDKTVLLTTSLLQAPHASWCESLSCRHCVGLDSIQQMEQHGVYHDSEPLPCNCYVRGAIGEVK